MMDLSFPLHDVPDDIKFSYVREYLEKQDLVMMRESFPDGFYEFDKSVLFESILCWVPPMTYQDVMESVIGKIQEIRDNEILEENIELVDDDIGDDDDFSKYTVDLELKGHLFRFIKNYQHDFLECNNQRLLKEIVSLIRQSDYFFFNDEDRDNIKSVIDVLCDRIIYLDGYPIFLNSSSLLEDIQLFLSEINSDSVYRVERCELIGNLFMFIYHHREAVLSLNNHRFLRTIISKIEEFKLSDFLFPSLSMRYMSSVELYFKNHLID